MKTPQLLVPVSLLTLLTALPACDAVDRARDRFVAEDSLVAVATGSGLMLGLQVPGALTPGDEGMIRVAVTNNSDTLAANIRVELTVPGWAEPLPPRAGDREVSMAAMPDGGTRFAFRMDDRPLEPGQTQNIEQRIRVPATLLGSDGAVPWSRLIRARLLGADDEPLVEVQSEIALDSTGVAGADRPAMSDTASGRDRLGPVRLGMSRDELSRTAPAARDTSWTQGGVEQTALLVALPSNGRAFAVLEGDSVVRIEARDSVARTRERVGVGSSLAELRAAYGTACAAEIDDEVVVWFSDVPGLTFALDTPVPQNTAQLRDEPGQIPGSATVTRWWLRQGADRCPR